MKMEDKRTMCGKSTSLAHRTEKTVRSWKLRVDDLVYAVADSMRLYRFDAERYGDCFLRRTVDEEPLPVVPRVIYVFWTGVNSLTPNRERALRDLQSMNPDIPIELVTLKNLPGHLLEGYPIHPAFEYLSFVHRADYLRCYFMALKGGGYSDLKSPTAPWSEAFDRLASNHDVWAVGYPEVGRIGVVRLEGRLGTDLVNHWRLLVGNGAYIFKPRTPLAFEWFNELNRRLDEYLPKLRTSPGGIWGDLPGYPISWTNILGDIFHPLNLKYSDRLIQDLRLLPKFTEYR